MCFQQSTPRCRTPLLNELNEVAFLQFYSASARGKKVNGVRLFRTVVDSNKLAYQIQRHLIERVVLLELLSE